MLLNNFSTNRDFAVALQTWADAFRGVPELKEVEKVYQELKSKGIEFPMTDLDNMVPIHTPARVSTLSVPLGWECSSVGQVSGQACC